MKALLVSVEGACSTEEQLGALSEVLLVIYLDLSASILYVSALLMQFRGVNSVQLSLLVLLEVALHLQGTLASFGCTEPVSFRLVARSSRAGIVVHEGVSMSGLGTEPGCVNEFY